MVKKIAFFANKLNFTPNIITLCMLFSSIGAVLGYIILDSLIWFGIWIFITGILDGVDGALARIQQKSSPSGGFFDSVMDRISEAILYLGLILGNFPVFREPLNITLFSKLWKLLCLIGFFSSFIISYSRTRVDLSVNGLNRDIDSNIGMFGRSERLIALIVWAISSFWVTSQISFLIFVLFAFGNMIMAFYRIYSYRKSLKDINDVFQK